ncbi:MAG TPA: hypothetical protein VKG38_05270 [Solirubrobacteraceae bacterium]|nr:hypothetical protein [Solirubrobacteraceae bacterium]
MPATVYVLTETNTRSGLTIAVFAERCMAIDAARSWALHRARRCREMGLKRFGASGAGTYEGVVAECDTRARVSVLHRPSGERDDCAWHGSPFEIVEPPASR